MVRDAERARQGARHSLQRTRRTQRKEENDWEGTLYSYKNEQAAIAREYGLKVPASIARQFQNGT